MNVLASIRDRFNALIAAAIGAVLVFACGATLTFFLAPKQKLEANHIEGLPLLDSGSLASTPAGEEVLLTGRLVDNPLMDEGGFVAYRLEEWVVTLPDPDDPDDEPTGGWEEVERIVPELLLEVGGDIVRSLRADNATLSGSLHEEILYSDAYEEAKYEGVWLPHGSWRFRGLFNGDLVSVLGKKASEGGIIPDELYAGDRVAFVDSKHEAVKGLLIGGVAMMICSPLILIGGIFAAVLGRRR